MAPVANPFKDNLDDLTDSDDLGELSLSPKQPLLTTSASIQHQSWVQSQGSCPDAQQDQDKVKQ